MKRKKYGLVQAFKLLVKNKFYLMICGTYILQQLYSAMIGAGIYYMTWVFEKQKSVWTICLGGKHSSYHCVNIYTNTGWKVEWYV